MMWLFYVVGAVGEKNTRLLRVFFLPPAPPVRPWFQFSLSSGGASRRLARLPVHATVGTQTSPSAIRVPVRSEWCEESSYWRLVRTGVVCHIWATPRLYPSAKL